MLAIAVKYSFYRSEHISYMVVMYDRTLHLASIPYSPSSLGLKPAEYLEWQSALAVLKL